MRASMLCLTAAVLAALPTIAPANTIPCAPGTIATVLAQGTCTIGNLAFHFTSYSYSYTSDQLPPAITAADVTFTPLTDGFELGGDFEACADLCFLVESGDLLYSISVTSGRPLVEIGASINDGRVGTSCIFGVADAGLSAENQLSSSATKASQTIYEQQPDNCNQFPSYYNSGPGSTVFAPILSSTGQASFSTTASATAFASMTSMDYTFGVPEPGSIPLLGTMAIALAALTRGMRRRAAR